MKAQRLREWREARGWTQIELGERAGVAHHTISRIETGSDLTVRTARKLADALGVEVADLLGAPPVPLAEVVPGARRLTEEDRRLIYNQAYESLMRVCVPEYRECLRQALLEAPFGEDKVSHPVVEDTLTHVVERTARDLAELMVMVHEWPPMKGSG